MKKVALVLVVVLVFGVYILYQHQQTGVSSASVASFQTVNTPVASDIGVANVSYKDGEYTGSVADATYGNIQVKVTIAGGKIIDISYLQFPDKVGHTTEVSDSSLPVLKQEAISKQSANVDIVSGATQTSEGFMQTLQSALDQAKV